MDESLKTLRLTHRTILTLLVGVMMFALYPNKHQTYEKAYGFLERLESIDEVAYENWADSIANQHLVSRHALLNNIFESLATRGGPEIEWQNLKNDTVTGGLVVNHQKPGVNHYSIESINQSFRDDLPVMALTLSTEKITSLLLNKLEPSKKYRLDNFTIAGTSGIGRMDLQVYLYDESGKLEHVMGTVKFNSKSI